MPLIIRQIIVPPFPRLLATETYTYTHIAIMADTAPCLLPENTATRGSYQTSGCYYQLLLGYVPSLIVVTRRMWERSCFWAFANWKSCPASIGMGGGRQDRVRVNIRTGKARGNTETFCSSSLLEIRVLVMYSVLNGHPGLRRLGITTFIS